VNSASGKSSDQLFLLVVAIDSEVLFQSLISSFGLSITFGMISRCEVKLHVRRGSEGAEKVGYKFHAAIGSYVGGGHRAWRRHGEQRVVQVVET